MKSKIIIFSPVYITGILYLFNLYTESYLIGDNNLLANSLYLIAISGFMGIILFIYFKEFIFLKAYAIITFITIGVRTMAVLYDYFASDVTTNNDVIILIFIIFVLMYLIYFLSLILIAVQAIKIENPVLTGIAFATIIYFYYEFSTKIDDVFDALSSIMPLIAAEVIILSIGVLIKVAFLWFLNYESLFIQTNTNEEG